MNKRKIKKEAYRLIFKENQSHQDTFNQLKRESELSDADLANLISATPSKQMLEKKKNLWMIFVYCVGIIMVMRIIGVIVLTQATHPKPFVFFVYIIPGIILPIIAMAGAYRASVQTYRIIGILFLANVVRVSVSGELRSEFAPNLILALFIISAGLAFYITKKLKTPYTKQITKKENSESRMEIHFEEENLVNENDLQAST